jgi:2-hydroxychromene-2-carboxylate isomerase
VKGLDLSTAESLATIELPVGIESDWIDNGIGSDEAGQLLRSAVDESLKLGVFGSPTVRIDDELFWGVQNFGLIEEWLEQGGW